MNASWRATAVAIAMVTSFVFASGCKSNDTDATRSNPPAVSEKPLRETPGPLAIFVPATRVPAGTGISVRLETALSSKTSHVGDGWSGVVTSPVTVGDKVVVRAGSPVHGVVVSALPAERGSRARLQLALRSVVVRDKKQHLTASAEPVIAPSPRTRNLGAIAG